MINAASPVPDPDVIVGTLSENCPKGHPLKPFLTPVDGYVVKFRGFILFKVFM